MSPVVVDSATGRMRVVGSSVDVWRVLEMARAGVEVDAIAAWFRLSPFAVVAAIGWALEHEALLEAEERPCVEVCGEMVAR